MERFTIKRARGKQFAFDYDVWILLWSRPWGQETISIASDIEVIMKDFGKLTKKRNDNCRLLVLKDKVDVYA